MMPNKQVPQALRYTALTALVLAAPSSVWAQWTRGSYYNTVSAYTETALRDNCNGTQSYRLDQPVEEFRPSRPGSAANLTALTNSDLALPNTATVRADIRAGILETQAAAYADALPCGTSIGRGAARINIDETVTIVSPAGAASVEIFLDSSIEIRRPAIGSSGGVAFYFQLARLDAFGGVGIQPIGLPEGTTQRVYTATAPQGSSTYRFTFLIDQQFGANIPFPASISLNNSYRFGLRIPPGAICVSASGTMPGCDGALPLLSVDLLDPVPLMLTGPAVTSTQCALSTGGRIVNGVAADGVTQLVVRVHTPSLNDSVTLTLPAGTSVQPDTRVENGTIGAIGAAQAGSTLQVTANCPDPDGSGGLAFAAYRAPVDFAWTATQEGQAARVVQLSAQNTQGAQLVTNIAIVRPPVILVHGYATNAAKTWDEFDPLDGAGTALVRIYRVDYGQRIASDGLIVTATTPPTNRRVLSQRYSHFGFTWNQGDVAAQLRSSVSKYAAGDNALGVPVAAVQADVIAHSMGGLVMRYWTSRRDEYLAPGTFGQGYIHKLITLGTPHFGSPQAILSLDNGAGCSRDVGALLDRFALSSATVRTLSSGLQTSFQMPGASEELSGDGVGTFLSAALDEIKARSYPVPTVMLAGDVTPVLGNLTLATAAFYLRNRCAGDPLADRYTPTAFSTIFDPNIRPGNPAGSSTGAASDGSVPLTSAFRDPSVTLCSGALCAAGVAHGAGTALFFAPSLNHLLDNSRTISLLVEALLNLPTTNAGWKR